MFRVIIGIMILASHLAVGQSFGQNKVQYRNFIGLLLQLLILIFIIMVMVSI